MNWLNDVILRLINHSVYIVHIEPLKTIIREASRGGIENRKPLFACFFLQLNRDPNNNGSNSPIKCEARPPISPFKKEKQHLWPLIKKFKKPARLPPKR